MAYQIETWIEYAFCTTVMALRLFVRIRIRGRKGLDWDDYLMGLAFVGGRTKGGLVPEYGPQSLTAAHRQLLR